ncbi:MAG: HPr family phosphocarrier protein [Lachnospiraceae bacterium]
MATFQYTIKDELGIHARPAGQIVKQIKELDCKVTIEKEGKPAVDAARMMALMGLGIKCGETITITVDGDNAEGKAVALEEFLATIL